MAPSGSGQSPGEFPPGAQALLTVPRGATVTYGGIELHGGESVAVLARRGGQPKTKKTEARVALQGFGDPGSLTENGGGISLKILRQLQLGLPCDFTAPPSWLSPLEELATRTAALSLQDRFAQGNARAALVAQLSVHVPNPRVEGERFLDTLEEMEESPGGGGGARAFMYGEDPTAGQEAEREDRTLGGRGIPLGGRGYTQGGHANYWDDATFAYDPTASPTALNEFRTSKVGKQAARSTHLEVGEIPLALQQVKAELHPTVVKSFDVGAAVGVRATVTRQGFSAAGSHL